MARDDVERNARNRTAALLAAGFAHHLGRKRFTHATQVAVLLETGANQGRGGRKGERRRFEPFPVFVQPGKYTNTRRQNTRNT